MTDAAGPVKMRWVHDLPSGPPDRDGLARLVDADGGRDEAENAYYEAAADPGLFASKRRSVGFEVSTSAISAASENDDDTASDMRPVMPRGGSPEDRRCRRQCDLSRLRTPAAIFAARHSTAAGLRVRVRSELARRRLYRAP